MASGLPDFYRGMRPQYGGTIYKEGSEAVLPDAATGLALASGKGMLYGGVVWLDAAETQADSEIRLIIDDEYISNLSFIRMLDYGMTKPGSWLLYLNKFDAINNIYSVGMGFGVTFEDWMLLTYRENYGRTPTVHWRFCYAML